MWEKHESEVKIYLRVKSSEVENQKFILKHLQILSFLQHERLIHLIVTMTVAVLSMLSVLATIVTGFLYLLIPDFMLAGLLMAYLIHYQKLENKTQRWYKLTDLIREKSN